MKKHTIIGTAGHIDHGKTAVIKALTGIDADRLKEEKERGITIDIGFAYWKDNVTILDVPGHERFIRNMVAGVNTVDFFLLVIAADDGIMPQTIEHLDILNFFNIRDGIVVINKIDLVDEEWLDLVEEEVKQLLEKYRLTNIPICKVSAVSNLNIDNLQDIIEKKIVVQVESESTQPFRLLVDRSFIVKGFGTVVTGTVLSGRLKKGEEIEVLPTGLKRKVRGLQAHSHDTHEVVEGDRAAINLQGISKQEIKRGDVLIRPDTLANTFEFIGTLRTVSKLPVKIGNRSKVRVYVGTSEKIGQLIWYEDHKNLKEETTYHVRVKLDESIASARNDAFLIRLHSPLITLAGGRILEINPPKIHHQKQEWQEYFKIMSTDDYDQIITTIIKKRYLDPISSEFLQQVLFDNEKVIGEIISNLIKYDKIRVIPIKGIDHYISEQSFNQLISRFKDYVSEFHNNNPHLPGLNQQELLNGSGHTWISPEVAESALRKMINSKILKLEQNLYSLPEFTIQVSKDIEEVKEQVINLLSKARFSPSTIAEMSHTFGMPQDEIRSIFNLLRNDKKLIQINQELYLYRDVWEELLTFLREYFSKHDEMPVAALKKFINTTRKYAIPLFEFLDSEGYTLRVEDVRRKGHML